MGEGLKRARAAARASRKGPKLTAPEDIAAHFGAQAPVGTPCRYYPVRPCRGDNFVETRIRSAPWILGDGCVVVAVEGLTGGKSIEHVVLLPPKATT
jgi:hypothetical protein